MLEEPVRLGESNCARLAVHGARVGIEDSEMREGCQNVKGRRSVSHFRQKATRWNCDTLTRLSAAGLVRASWSIFRCLPPNTRPPATLPGKRDGSLLAARGLLRPLGLRWRLRPGLRRGLRPLLSRHVWLPPVDLLSLRQ